ESYLDLGWDAEPVSVLHPQVCGGSAHGVLAVHSLSKRSNMAGYRAGFVAGDPALIADLLEIRRHAGMMMPSPVQAAMAAALADDAHAEEQRARYATRRERLRAALAAAGWATEHSEAGLYLWVARPGLDCWGSVQLLAEAGILVAPGGFYGPACRWPPPAPPGTVPRGRPAGTTCGWPSQPPTSGSPPPWPASRPLPEPSAT